MYLPTYLPYLPTCLPTSHPSTYLLPTSTYRPIPTYTYLYLPIPTYTYLYLPTYLPTYIHTYIHTSIHTYIITYMCVTYVCICVYIYIYIVYWYILAYCANDLQWQPASHSITSSKVEGWPYLCVTCFISSPCRTCPKLRPVQIRVCASTSVYGYSSLQPGPRSVCRSSGLMFCTSLTLVSTTAIL